MYININLYYMLHSWQILSSIEAANLEANLQPKMGLIHGHRVIVASVPDVGKYDACWTYVI